MRRLPIWIWAVWRSLSYLASLWRCCAGRCLLGRHLLQQFELLCIDRHIDLLRILEVRVLLWHRNENGPGLSECQYVHISWIHGPCVPSMAYKTSFRPPVPLSALWFQSCGNLYLLILCLLRAASVIKTCACSSSRYGSSSSASSRCSSSSPCWSLSCPCSSTTFTLWSFLRMEGLACFPAWLVESSRDTWGTIATSAARSFCILIATSSGRCHLLTKFGTQSRIPKKTSIGTSHTCVTRVDLIKSLALGSEVHVILRKLLAIPLSKMAIEIIECLKDT